MRLINVSTLEMEEFQGADVPKYAILSHTWGREEMTLSELETVVKHRHNQSQHLLNQQKLMAGTTGSLTTDRADAVRMMLLSSMLVAIRTGSYPLNSYHSRSRSITDGRLGENGHHEEDEKRYSHMSLTPATLVPHPLESKAGFSKILSACKQAASDGHQYLWADTCCIDKTNGYEVSEAINSMFSWYQDAAVCYAHLEDVEFGGEKQGYRTWEHELLKSRWFTRGWTLQELVAPRRVVFFANGWQWLGTKSDATLSKHIAKITKIEDKVLADPDHIPKTCIARRMAWASQRKTTRPEDASYSLLGIFNVHMPLLYGEGGENAFVRLQEEIIKTSDDHTLFAWGLVKQPGAASAAVPVHYDSLDEFDHDEMVGMTSILARSPADFGGMDRVVPAATTMDEGDTAYKMTNKGLKIKLKLWPVNATGEVVSRDQPQHYLGVLNCQHNEDDPSSRLGMLLTEIPETPNVLFRTRTRTYLWVSGSSLAAAVPRQVYICQNNPAQLLQPRAGQSDELIWIKARDLVSPGYGVVDIQAKRSHWNREFSTLRAMGIADKVFYQLAVVTFYNRHMGQGFFVRVLVDGSANGKGRCFVDLGQPKRIGTAGRKGGEDETPWLKDEAKKLWNSPGQIRIVAPQPGGGAKGMMKRTLVEDIANPDVYGTDEQSAWKSKNMDDGWEAVADSGEFSPTVTFAEAWEKEYMRTVRATVDRRKDVIVLEISSMLWEAGPAAAGVNAGEDAVSGDVAVDGAKDVVDTVGA